MNIQTIIDRVFTIDSDEAFEVLAMEVFAFQYANNAVYREFCDALKRSPAHVEKVTDIPFLPVGFFKTHKVVSFQGGEEAVFLSSGTTSQPDTQSMIPGINDQTDVFAMRSRHFIKDLALYHRSFTECFRRFYDDPSEYCILALLPSYLEREGSSLVCMVDELIKQSGHPDSGFYLDNLQGLSGKLVKLSDSGDKVLLLGVSFALLDLAQSHPTKIKNAVVMETGGMKGRRREMIREELHGILKDSFGVGAIHSEYGMTELLSQAYSKGDGMFACPPWMRVLIRDSHDPLQINDVGRAGGINIVDLANVHSCSFLATEDLGKTHPNGLFEVLGRFDNSDIRGCNLLVVG